MLCKVLVGKYDLTLIVSKDITRGPIPIDLFCSLIFMPSVTEIQLNKLRARFPA